MISAQIKEILNPAWIKFDSSAYSVKWIPKKSWGCRELFVPNDQLKTLQKKYANYIHGHCTLPKKSNFFSYRKWFSVIDNARHHIWENEKSFCIRIDLKDFFQSIDIEKIKTSFEQFLWEEKKWLIEWIGQVSTVTIPWKEPFLATGSPLSPVVSNIVGHYLIDLPILKELKKLERRSLKKSTEFVRYSRYSDDIILTLTSEDIDKINLVRQVCTIIKSAWFTVNTKKIKFMPPAMRQTITGIVINSGKPSIPKQTRDDVYFYCKLAIRHGGSAAIEKWNRSASGRKRFAPSNEIGFLRMLLWKINWIGNVMGNSEKLRNIETCLHSKIWILNGIAK